MPRCYGKQSSLSPLSCSELRTLHSPQNELDLIAGIDPTVDFPDNLVHAV